MKRGITLIELLITLTIISIIATYSFVKFDNYIRKVKLRTTSYQLNSLISTIKMKTYSTERTHWLKFEDNSCSIYQDDGDEKFTSKDIKLEKYTLLIPTGITTEFTNSKIQKYGLKFKYDKCWWPAGSVTLSNKTNYLKYKITFPVNSQRSNFYQIVNNYATQKF